MKIWLFLLLCAAIISGCTAGREIQMNIIDVELVKIDTVQRYPDDIQKILTWRSGNNVDFITFEPITNSYILGSKLKVMMRK